jgi:hypothetical protein
MGRNPAQALCALIAIAMVHSDNKLTCAIALAIFATGAISVLLIAAYSPFTANLGHRNFSRSLRLSRRSARAQPSIRD